MDRRAWGVYLETLLWLETIELVDSFSRPGRPKPRQLKELH